MKTISIISQKSGAGKTTLALNLAGAAEAFGHRCVVIVSGLAAGIKCPE